jgi:hypothetical protein
VLAFGAELAVDLLRQTEDSSNSERNATMRTATKSLLLVGSGFWFALCYAQQPYATEKAQRNDAAMDVMRRHLGMIEVVGTDAREPFGEMPILRYSDAARGISDASVWRLADSGGRPRAVLVLEIYSWRSIQYEATAVVDPPRQLRGKRWHWSPTLAQPQWLRVPTRFLPSTDPNLRKRQIKQLARQFAASEHTGRAGYQLRLMPQPLYVYEDVGARVMDGAVFAWSHGTNVEILMIIEARTLDDGTPCWYAGFSRLSGASLEVSFENDVFWRCPRMPRPQPDDSYYYRIESLSTTERALLSSEQ